MPAQYIVAELPIGQGGLNGSKNQAIIPPQDLIVTNNLSYYEGTLTKEGGSSKYNTTSIGTSLTIVGGSHWRPTATAAREIIAASNGTIYRATGTASGATFTSIATGLTLTSGRAIFTEGGNESSSNNRKLFIYTGNNSVQVLAADGTTLATLTDPPTDWATTNQPIFGTLHENRIFAGGNLNDPHRLYYSTATDHEDIQTNGGTLSIYPGEGEGIVAAVSYKGFLVIFKFPKGIYIADTSNPTVTNWTIDRLNDQIGLAGPQAYCVIDDDILFMDAGGTFHLMSIITDESKGSKNISKGSNLQQWVTDNVNLGRLSRVKAVYYPVKSEAHFAMAGLNSQTNNLRIVVDFNDPNKIRFRTSDKDTCESIWIRQDANFVPRIAVGDDGGRVWKLDQTTKNKGGAAYTSEFQTPHMDLSWLDGTFSTLEKNGYWLECVVEPTGNWDLTVTIIWDGVDTETVTFNMGSNAAALGSFVLGTDALGGAYVLNKKRKIHGSGRRISLRGVNSAANQDFSIAKFFLHFKPGSRRIRA